MLLFALCWLTFAWFHQGGGWNQNARLAEVRAIVEQGTFAIDNFLVYRTNEAGQLERQTVVNGEFENGRYLYRLCWDTKDGPVAANGHPMNDDALPAIIGKETASGDVGFSPDGHFHPNKPPGASLLAVPAYFAAFHVERAAGYSPDDWRVLNFNAWLCSALTVGFASALCVVLFVQVALAMFPGRVAGAVGGALTLAFGTTFFPFATLLFDHNLTAFLLLAAFASVRSDRPAWAGAFAGAASVVNYLAAIPGILFGIWALARARRLRAAGHYLLGVLPFLAALLAYNTAAFGSPFVLNTSFQNPAFTESGNAFLGMFTAPSWFAMVCLTVSPWRGVFVLSPVIALFVVGLWMWCRTWKYRAEALVCVGIIGFFFLVNICFNGFHGGFSAGPRYLIPALPFACLPLVCVFSRWPWFTFLLSGFGITQQALLTATDAQNPLAMGDHAWRNKPLEWVDKMHGNSLVWLYAWPLFSEGHAWPTLRDKWEEWLEKYPDLSPEDRAEAWSRVTRGEREPLLLAAIPGPVSVNTIGPWEGTFFATFEPHSPQSDFASCNAGELLLPGSRWSLAPLALLWAGWTILWFAGTRRRRVEELAFAIPDYGPAMIKATG